ncbi:MAG TPA: hypothetical protein VMK30_02810 [Pleomorphomonadaceae bacterium]|nr:hypothetical protein [Pleomorphomonadaceae bacterium]
MNQRPTGVTILAILAFVGGILSILAALALLGLGGLAGAGFGGLALFFGIYAWVWGALALWIGWGFWQLRPSAWRWGIILMVVGAVITLIQIPLGYSGGIASAAISIAIDLAVIYYLTTPAVRAAFGQPTSGGMMDAVMGAFGMGGGTATADSAPPPAPPVEPPEEPPVVPPAMTPPAGSTWSGSPGSTGGETSMGGEAAERDEDEKL